MKCKRCLKDVAKLYHEDDEDNLCIRCWFKSHATWKDKLMYFSLYTTLLIILVLCCLVVFSVKGFL